jgi:hypothetical protein
MGDGMSQLRGLEGRQVSVALADGSRIDDCSLVSVGRGRTTTVWIFTNGCDLFVEFSDVVDVWEAAPRRQRRAA